MLDQVTPSLRWLGVCARRIFLFQVSCVVPLAVFFLLENVELRKTSLTLLFYADGICSLAVIPAGTGKCFGFQ